MAFRFGFSFRKSKSGECHLEPGQDLGRSSASLVRPVAREVFLSEKAEEKVAETDVVNLQGGLSLLKGRASTSDLLGISHCDIVLGKYEGGFKLWECAIDLIEVLRREIEDGRLSFRGKHVLELGCGHGLPGIFACLKGAARVHFQDYNVEVLTHLTMPNVEANIAAHEDASVRQQQQQQLPRQGPEGLELASSHRPPISSCDIHYYAGDWADMDTLFSSPPPSLGNNGINIHQHHHEGSASPRLPLLSSPSSLSSVSGRAPDNKEQAQDAAPGYNDDGAPPTLPAMVSPDTTTSATAASGERVHPVEGSAAAAAAASACAAVSSPSPTPCLSKSRSHSRSFSRANEVAAAASAAELATVGGYDIILMSETVYSTASLPLLLHLIKKCLRSPYGVVYVAGKKLYFGVGGGTRQFKTVVDEDGTLSGHLVTDIVDGSSNIREIWKFFYRSRRNSTLEPHDLSPRE